MPGIASRQPAIIFFEFLNTHSLVPKTPARLADGERCSAIDFSL